MTGRRLYDRYVDATCYRRPWRSDTPPLVAWPELQVWRRDAWNDMARAMRTGARFT